MGAGGVFTAAELVPGFDSFFFCGFRVGWHIGPETEVAVATEKDGVLGRDRKETVDRLGIRPLAGGTRRAWRCGRYWVFQSVAVHDLA